MSLRCVPGADDGAGDGRCGEEEALPSEDHARVLDLEGFELRKWVERGGDAVSAGVGRSSEDGPSEEECDDAEIVGGSGRLLRHGKQSISHGEVAGCALRLCSDTRLTSSDSVGRVTPVALRNPLDRPRRLNAADSPHCRARGAAAPANFLCGTRLLHGFAS